MRRLIRTIVTPAIALLSTAAVAGDASPTPNGSGDAPAAPPPAATPPAPPAAPSAPPPAQSGGTPAVVLDTQDYESLLGKSVRAMNGDDLGRIIDVIIDRDGRPRAAVIDFGGFLGVGSRKIAVDWRVLKFTTEGKVGRLVLQLNRNQVRVSPEYKAGEPIVVLGAASPATTAAPVEADPAGTTPATPAPTPAAVPAPAPDKPADPAVKPQDKPQDNKTPDR
ncbi:PRC-barrel domain-containing protein [Methylorubrum salsuginis]|uniref:PRC-barrel domain-containing protein n=1 Tax=Methylorubrum salsuginis TaxID=414703 RepID=A0A1I4GV43_9HYPH|nr:PRC-barrel domain-containing protein [Methylorubrum salsuginis]SFL33845.1 PRC-barrel domain-containing protein [Methylorubrum salsuginis]